MPRLHHPDLFGAVQPRRSVFLGLLGGVSPWLYRGFDVEVSRPSQIVPVGGRGIGVILETCPSSRGIGPKNRHIRTQRFRKIRQLL